MKILKPNLLILGLCLITSSKSFSAAYEPYVLWEKPELKLCFKPNRSTVAQTELESYRHAEKEYGVDVHEMDTSEKQKVLKFISEVFSSEKTGVSFVVDPHCEDFDVLVVKNRPKIRFGRAKKKYGRASIGEAGEITWRGRGFFSKKRGFYSKSGYKAYVALATIDRTTTLHEFGHIAGLRHEHARDEAFKDPGCAQENPPSAGRNSSLQERLDITTEVFGPYDPNSFMNYCYINREREAINSYQKPALSKRDIETLIHLFRQ